ncbi:MAG: polyprenyl synthetase family protein [Myxococcota bacterium]
MTISPQPSPTPTAPVMGRLVQVAERRGLSGLAGALVALSDFVANDLVGVERQLSSTPTRGELVGSAAQHLLDLKGKRIRPLCVALAARAGKGFDERGVKLAAAVELVHSATLLHDDVVDHGDERRGRPTARVLFGNAASVFAGDWLLIRALRLVRETGLDDLTGRLLDIIEVMIEAESVQLERRGVLQADRDAYFHIIEGKTASLFRWAMEAGGRAGGLEWQDCRAMAQYGNELGMAFQIVDDALDLSGSTGKSMYTDIKEGKLTYPLLVALEQRPEMRQDLEAVLENQGAIDGRVEARIRRQLEETRAVDRSLELAQEHATRARNHIARLPDSQAKEGLELVAEVAVRRPS